VPEKEFVMIFYSDRAFSSSRKMFSSHQEKHKERGKGRGRRGGGGEREEVEETQKEKQEKRHRKFQPFFSTSSVSHFSISN
jgi:hypothetical protein